MVRPLFARLVAWIGPILGSALVLAALAVRHAVHPGFEWLALNLALAWVPLVLGAIAARNPTLLVLVGPAWLLFLPNAPYLLTDLVHLRHRAPIPLWFDAALLGGTGALGLGIGAMSLREVAGAVRRWFGGPFAHAMYAIVPALCGFGMVLGRELRFNSWDVVFRPYALLDDVVRLLVRPGANLDTWALALTFGSVFLAAAAFAPAFAPAGDPAGDPIGAPGYAARPEGRCVHPPGSSPRASPPSRQR